MTSSASRRLYASALMLVASLFAGTASASKTGSIGLSVQAASDDMDQLISLSLYSPVDRRLHYYGVADLVWYRADPAMDLDFTLRVAVGFTTGGSLAPYIELGSSLYDLLVITVNDDEKDNTCRASLNESCRIDFNIKAGVRYDVNERVKLDAYFMRLKFGNIDNEIEGNFDSFGIGFGYRF